MNKLLISLITMLVLFAIPKSAFAQSSIYLSQEPGAPRPQTPGPDNWLMHKWGGMTPGTVTWKSDPAIRPYVVSALTSWQAVMPSQSWVEVSNNPNVEFKDQACPNGGIGCANVTSWAGTWTSNTTEPNWNWMWHVDVYSTFNNNYSNDAKIGQIAHEIGHVFGLANRYIPGVSCGPNDVTIMDAMKINSNGTITHCDNVTGPTALDDQRASDFFATGEFNTFQSVLNGNTLKYTWYDLAWADNRHGLYFYYQDGSTWTIYAGPIGTFIDVGLHKQIEARQLTMQINPNNYGAPHGRYYMACGWPIYSNSYGTFKCSNSTLWP